MGILYTIVPELADWFFNSVSEETSSDQDWLMASELWFSAQSGLNCDKHTEI